MFASRSVPAHVARGLLGIGALCMAAVWASSRPWLALLAFPVALVLLRGCPMCWMLGLIETLQARLPNRAKSERHGDGSSARCDQES